MFPMHIYKQSKKILTHVGKSLEETLEEMVSERITCQSVTLHMHFFWMTHLVSFQHMNL